MAAGAFLGVFFANWIYDAHHGRPESHRPSIFRTEKVAWSLDPSIDDEGRFGLTLSVSL